MNGKMKTLDIVTGIQMYVVMKYNFGSFTFRSSVFLNLIWKFTFQLSVFEIQLICIVERMTSCTEQHVMHIGWE